MDRQSTILGRHGGPKNLFGSCCMMVQAVIPVKSVGCVNRCLHLSLRLLMMLVWYNTVKSYNMENPECHRSLCGFEYMIPKWLKRGKCGMVPILSQGFNDRHIRVSQGFLTQEEPPGSPLGLSHHVFRSTPVQSHYS